MCSRPASKIPTASCAEAGRREAGEINRDVSFNELMWDYFRELSLPESQEA